MSKQGKLKKKRNKKKTLLQKPDVQKPEVYSEEEGEEDVLPSISTRDLTFLKKAVNEKKYDFLSGLDLTW